MEGGLRDTVGTRGVAGVQLEVKSCEIPERAERGSEMVYEDGMSYGLRTASGLSPYSLKDESLLESATPVGSVGDR